MEQDIFYYIAAECVESGRIMIIFQCQKRVVTHGADFGLLKTTSRSDSGTCESGLGLSKRVRKSTAYTVWKLLILIITRESWDVISELSSVTDSKIIWVMVERRSVVEAIVLAKGPVQFLG